MAVDEKGVSLAILGVVAVIAVVGLVLLFSSAKTGRVAGDDAKISSQDRSENTARFVVPVPGAEVRERSGLSTLQNCDLGWTYVGSGLRSSTGFDVESCRPAANDPNGWCCLPKSTY